MSDFLPQLLFLPVGGAIAPPLLLLTILFLGSPRPLPNGTALALGYFATCAAVGIAGLALFDGAAETISTSTAGRVISVSVGGLLIVLGLRSLLNTPDPDAPPPKWIESITSTTPARAFGIAMVLFPIQIKNFAIFVACVNLAVTASLDPQASIAALVLVLLVFAVPVLAHRPLRGRATASLDHSRLVAGMDGEEQSRDHGRALLGVRGVLPRQRFLGTAGILSTYRITAMDKPNKPVLTPLLGAASPPVTGYVRLLAHSPGDCDG